MITLIWVDETQHAHSESLSAGDWDIFYSPWGELGPGDSTDETAPPTSHLHENQNKPATNQHTELKLIVNVKITAELNPPSYLPLACVTLLTARIYLFVLFFGLLFGCFFID